jgi:hypothetical protein
VKTAAFDIITKQADKENWISFTARDPIEVSFDAANDTALFKTPLFTAELSNPTNNSFEARIFSVADTSSGFGFKRSLVKTNKDGYLPGYQIAGN